ncbi:MULTISPECIES: hypothetical protein [unclassified Caulobacter]|uniref:hypothetical protein n=1 Tax=unclassified Caulobacter TaxID=2648921 RepID=UPI000D3AC21F|nr:MULTISPECIES: hypothetical protein [unclassified Caulobacter]PTT78103.1 hypothetical protein DBR41_23575 [Pseudomonas sp. HMWF010]
MFSKLVSLVFGRRKVRREPAFDVDAFLDSTSPLTLETVSQKLEALSSARPEDVIHLGPELCASLRFQYSRDTQARALALIGQHPRLAWLLTFHGNGRVREPALRALDHPPSTASEFIAIALRLNDWASAVRESAHLAAVRLFPLTPADVVAAAAPYLLARRFSWARWDVEADVLDEALARPDVAAQLANTLGALRTGPGGGILRMAARFPSLDPYLPWLAQHALHPAVRASALEMLVTGQARWTTGYGWAWVDKVYGIQRRVPVTVARPLNLRLDVEPLIRLALSDRFAAARRVAADALYERRANIDDVMTLAQSILNDPSRPVRERAEFLVRRLSET